MRVLHVIDAFRLGGAETLLANLGNASQRIGVQSQVLSVSGPDPEHSVTEELLRQANLSPHYLGARRTLDAAAFVRLVRILRNSSFDVVHAHLEMAATVAVPAARAAGVPVVSTFHHVFRPLPRRAAARERAAVEVATHGGPVIFCSEASLDSFHAKYRRNRSVPSTWRVVHNGIDVSRFPGRNSGSVLPQDVRGHGDGPVLTVLAALRDFKGIDTAVRALPGVLARYPGTRLLLVGSGPEEMRLRDLVATTGVGTAVEFLGTRFDVAEILAASDVVLLPSTHGENLPTTVMEAGACGVPVVASAIGGIPDIIQDGVTGFLTPPGDAASVTARILQLLQDPGLRSTMGSAAQERIGRLFEVDGWARRLLDTYHEAGAEEPTGPRPLTGVTA